MADVSTNIYVAQRVAGIDADITSCRDYENAVSNAHGELVSHIPTVTAKPVENARLAAYVTAIVKVVSAIMADVSTNIYVAQRVAGIDANPASRRHRKSTIPYVKT